MSFLLKSLLIKYKSVITFILTFLGVYILFSISYKFYLQFSDGSKFYPDYLTHIVSLQTADILNVLGYKASVSQNPQEPSMYLILNNNYVARIVEGCNAVSVIILFLSFIVAFSEKFKTTFLYIITGSVLIYVVNLLRIVLLSIWMYHYPDQSEIMHGVVFPAIIYGMVFLLWVFWVNRFSNIKKQHV